MRRRTFMSTILGGLGLGVLARPSPSEIDKPGGLVLQESPLAGFEHHKAAHVWPYLYEGATLRLMREPTNPEDSNAVAVYYKGDKLGYVPRRENATLAQLMDRRCPLHARITRLRRDANPWRRIRLEVALAG